MRRFLPDKVTCASAFSGLLLACSFPLPDYTALAWFGLIPLIVVMQHRPFKSGFVAGVVFFATTLYWLNIVMTTYGHLPLAVSFLLYLLLAGYLALFWGTATWAACRLKEFRNYSYALTLPVLWVALEFLREFLLTGFPWATLGYSQHAWLPMIQSADLFGVYGLSYLLLLGNVVLGLSLLALRPKSSQSVISQTIPGKACFVTVLLLLLNYGYGQWSLQQDLDGRDETLQAALVQGNIPQDLKWHPDNQLHTVKTYRDLSLRAERSGASDLIVWPEAAMPFYFQDGGPLAESIAQLPVETGSSLLFGSPAYRRTPGADKDTGGLRYLNSAFLLSPTAQILGRSDKVHLVPFGEYVPLSGFLPFVNKLVAGIGDYSPGEITPLPIQGHQLGVLVCYEVIFPELAREYVRQGSDLLVNITNDAWFGKSSAPWQHLAMARFRAIENRVWLVRAANTGISAFVSPSGKIVQQSDLFETALLTGAVGLGARPGLYSHMGDIVPGGFLIISLLWLIQTRRRFL
ncbi:MAG: apolipoprotein N-acyltransferase [Desulfuromonadales bacterium]|nr:apolipoprotein N-acyltransferase [Desulfuromonadales bacterium]